MSTQPVLAFDCACMGGSVALRAGSNTISRRIGQTKEAAELVPAIDALLREAGVAYSELGAVISTVGPGSFTGVRIGLAVLHGLALARGIPVKTLTTLEAMAWAVVLREKAPARFHVALKAGKGELYTQAFTFIPTQVIQTASDIALTPEMRDRWDAPCFGNHLDVADAQYLHGPDATVLCALAEKLSLVSLAEALPVYVRPPDAAVGAPLPWLVQN